jgi:hypothetical protein
LDRILQTDKNIWQAQRIPWLFSKLFPYQKGYSRVIFSLQRFWVAFWRIPATFDLMVFDKVAVPSKTFFTDFQQRKNPVSVPFGEKCGQRGSWEFISTLHRRNHCV